MALNYVADLEDEVALEGLDGITVEGKRELASLMTLAITYTNYTLIRLS